MVEILVKHCSLYNKYLLPLVLISVEFPEIGADAWDVLFFGVAKEKSSKKLISNKPCVNPLPASRKKRIKANFVFNETNYVKTANCNRNVCLKMCEMCA